MVDPAQQDDFASSIASMDPGQLQALLNEMGSRMNQEYALAAPDTPEAGVRLGAFQDPTKIYGKGLSGVPDIALKSASLYGQYKRYVGRKADKAKKAEAEAAGRAEQARQKQIMQERVNQVKQQIHTLGLRDKVNQQFRDLNLEGLFGRIAQQGLDQNVLGITQQHEDIANKTGFDAVSRGLGGGSYDATRIGDIQASQDQAIAQAAAQANQQKTSMIQTADAQRRSLLDSISGSNPGEDARLNDAISGIGQNANNSAIQSGIQGQNIQTAAQGQAGYSQALGGLLHSYAQMYNQG